MSNKEKPRFFGVKVLAKKQEQTYVSFMLKFGTEKKIFYTYTNNLCL